jgi:hypothetical protein
MKKAKKIAGLFLLFAVSATSVIGKQWEQITLPHVFRVPETNALVLDGKSAESKARQFEFTTTAKQYKLTMPASNIKSTDGIQWFDDTNECKKELNTTGQYPKSQQTVLRSDEIKSVSGLSFTGQLSHDTTNGSNYNHWAIFFHQKKCYNGGPEYGFVFFEDKNEALFYVCGNCNEKAQKWWDWPGNNLGNQNVNDPSNKVANALKNPSQYSNWSIIVKEDGNFLIEVTNIATNEKVSCTILLVTLR